MFSLEKKSSDCSTHKKLENIKNSSYFEYSKNIRFCVCANGRFEVKLSKMQTVHTDAVVFADTLAPIDRILFL